MDAARLISLGHHGSRRHSQDGVTWSEPVLTDRNHQFRSGVFAEGRYVAVGRWGDKGLAVGSSDGQTWDEVTVLEEAKSTKLSAVTFGSGVFLAVGGDGTNVGVANVAIVRSRDGRTFEKVSTEKGNALNSICYGNDRFVAAGDRGTVVVTKTGDELEEAPDRRPLDTFIAVAAGAGGFVGVGLHGLRMFSDDGLRWSEPQHGREGEHINSVVWVEDRFVAVGLGATFLSPDGRRWERFDNTDAPFSVVHSRGLYLGCNWRGRIFTSTDAVTWKQSAVFEHHVEGLIARG